MELLAEGNLPAISELSNPFAVSKKESIEYGVQPAFINQFAVVITQRTGVRQIF